MFRNGPIIGSKDEWDESVVNLLYYLFLYMADMTPVLEVTPNVRRFSEDW